MERDGDDIAHSTRRMRGFRERLASRDLRRWEVYVSDETKAQVRDIARREDISAGIAAEALLALGVAAYEAAAGTAPRHRSAGTSTPAGLAAYSRRVASEPSVSSSSAQRPAAKEVSATPSPMQAFIDKVKSKQAGRSKKGGDPDPGAAGR